LQATRISVAEITVTTAVCPPVTGNTKYYCASDNTATSSPADDVHHYVIPQKLLDSIFNKLPVFMRQWGKEKAVLYPV
jgi:hypothetical protein